MASSEDQPSPPSAEETRRAGEQEARKGLAGLLRRDMVANEQLAVYGGALFALIFGLSSSIPALLGHHHTAKQASPTAVLLLSLGVFVVLSAAARYGRRTVASVASLLSAFVMGTVLGFIYIALGGWLLFRSSRAQREARAAARGQTRPTRPARPGPAARAGARQARTGARSDRRSRGKAASAQRKAANKRYTPPSAKGRRR